MIVTDARQKMVEVFDHIMGATVHRLVGRVYVGTAWNSDRAFGIGNMDMKARYPDLSEFDQYSYGVAPDLETIERELCDRLALSERRFIVTAVHVEKEPGATGGWRWHKWGPYVGTGSERPTTEYLDDEPGFENGIYTFTVMEVL